MGDIILEEETFKIRGAAFEVYRELGNGFLESVYQECLFREFVARGIPSVMQKELVLYYKGERLPQAYRADFVCYESIIVELKACSDISKEHLAQVHNYLRASRLKLGLIINFGHFPGVEIKRIVM